MNKTTNFSALSEAEKCEILEQKFLDCDNFTIRKERTEFIIENDEGSFLGSFDSPGKCYNYIYIMKMDVDGNVKKFHVTYVEE